MNHFDSIVEECCQTLDSLDIPYAKNHKILISNNLKRCWGSCQRNADGSYTIRISSALLDENVPLSSLKATVYHELLHTVPGGMNHKKVWLQLAQKVSQTTGLTIKRSAPASEIGILRDYKNDPSVKFLCACENCGVEIIRYRKCDFIRRLDRYRCGTCGGKFKVVINRF